MMVEYRSPGVLFVASNQQEHPVYDNDFTSHLSKPGVQYTTPRLQVSFVREKCYTDNRQQDPEVLDIIHFFFEKNYR